MYLVPPRVYGSLWSSLRVLFTTAPGRAAACGSRLHRAHAAVDAVLRAGDEAAFVGRQEQHQVGDVDRLAIAAQRDGLFDPGPGGFGVGRVEAGFQRTPSSEEHAAERQSLMRFP